MEKISKILIGIAIILAVIGFSINYANAEPQINFLKEIPDSCITDEQGKFGMMLGSSSISKDSQDRIIVADTWNHRIQIFDKNGTFIKAFGCSGIAPGKFVQPGAVAVDHNDRILVADKWDRIQIFDKDGNLVDISGGTDIPWIDGNGAVCYPKVQDMMKGGIAGPEFRSIAVDSNNNIITIYYDMCNNDKYSIRIYNSNGGLVKEFGDIEPVYNADGSPYSTEIYTNLAVNSNNQIIVDYSKTFPASGTSVEEVRVYDSSGNFIKKVPNVNGFDALNSQDYLLVKKVNGVIGDPNYGKIEGIEVYDLNGTHIKTISGDIGSSNLMDWQPMVLDSQNRIIMGGLNNTITIFDANGTFINNFGGRGDVTGHLDMPFGVAVDHFNRTIVADTMNKMVQIFDADGKYNKTVQRFVNATSECWLSPQPLCDPVGETYDVAVDSNNRIVIVSAIRVLILNTTGSLITASDDLYYPASVDTDSQDRIIVADSLNSRVKIFDSNLNLIKTFGSNGSSNGQFYAPFGVAVDKDDKIIVADTLNNRVQIFDKNGNFIKKFGGEGTGNGEFNWPWGVAAYNDIIAVSDFNNHRIQFFDRNGTFIKSYGEIGFEQGQFITPTGLDFDDYGRLYVTDTGNYRIQSFELKNYAKDGWNCSANSECENNYCKNNTCTTDIVKTYSVSLNYGWNLISIPITPKNTSIKSVLASVEGKYTKVGTWINGTGKHYIPGFPFNTLNEINEKMGFWIKMNQSGVLVVEGYEPVNRSIPLQVGWNLVGYLSTNKTQLLTTALSSINGRYTKVGAWVNGTGKHYIPGFPFNTLINMSEGYGYWIKMNSAGVLEY